MKEFIEKLIERLEEEADFFGTPSMGSFQKTCYCKGVEKAIFIVNQLAEEYKTCIKSSCSNCEVYDKEKHYCSKWCDVIKGTVAEIEENHSENFCEWQYDEFEIKWQTDCGVLFALHDSDREITQYCPYCGKKIKIAPYQPKGE